MREWPFWKGVLLFSFTRLKVSLEKCRDVPFLCCIFHCSLYNMSSGARSTCWEQKILLFTVAAAGVRVSTLQDSLSTTKGTLKSFLRPPTTKDATRPDHDNVQPELVQAVPSPNTCPLCGAQVSAENSLLNQHIDECLNKPVIEEAVQGLHAHFTGSDCSSTSGISEKVQSRLVSYKRSRETYVTHVTHTSKVKRRCVDKQL